MSRKSLKIFVFTMVILGVGILPSFAQEDTVNLKFHSHRYSQEFHVGKVKIFKK